MVDVFISYKREEFARVDRLAEILGGLGLKVWHDASLVPGDDWQVRIDEVAFSAKCVLLCWTKEADRSKYVKRETKIGLDRKVLVPVKFGPGRFPFRLSRYHFADLSNWNDDLDDPGLEKLVTGIARYLPADRPIVSYLNETRGGHSPEAVATLRRHLVRMARRRDAPITYEQAKQLIAHTYKDGRATPDRVLYGTLDAIASQNRSKREPPLFGLVVLPDTRIPGRGYFQKHCFIQNHNSQLVRSVFAAQLEEVYSYGWPQDPD